MSGDGSGLCRGCGAPLDDSDDGWATLVTSDGFSTCSVACAQTVATVAADCAADSAEAAVDMWGEALAPARWEFDTVSARWAFTSDASAEDVWADYLRGIATDVN